LFLEVTGVWV